MVRSNKAKLNFSGGEVAPGVSARTDIPLFDKSLGRMENFIAEPKGTARYRSGFKYVHHTRNNAQAVFIEFQFSDIQAYMIEATDGYFRFYRNEAIILKDDTLAVTGITQADPAVLTYTGADPVEGEEVFISGVGGMTEVNGKFYTIANLNTGANTFELTDVFGDDVDASAYTAYTSGGTAGVVYEVKTPYQLADLETIKFSQNADTMYLVHENYEPRKLTRADNDDWTLTRYTRTANPFDTAHTITNITAANPAVLTYSGADDFADGDQVFIDSVVGMTQINNQHYLIANVNTGANTFELQTLEGVGVDASAFTAYSSAGKVELIGADNYPAAVGFTDDARLGLHGTRTSPETQWFSRSPQDNGDVRFDDFTTGTDDDHAIIFTLAPLQGKIDRIRWASNTDKYIAMGTFGSIRRIFGSTEQASISPTDATAKAANSDGVHPARPVVDGSVLFYIGRSGLSLETLEYDYQVDGYAPDDKNIVADHLTAGGIFRIARQVGEPNLIWVVRNDGKLLGLTFQAKENIAGWHRHTIGGDGAVETIGIMPRESNQDQLWAVIKRTINGKTVRYVEYMADEPVLPQPLDFYTGAANRDADVRRFLNYQSEQAKFAIHVDSALSYDGRNAGVDAGASLTFGAGAGTEDTEDVIVTASSAVFTASMVGRQLWGAYDANGQGGGRLEITSYTSTTQVEGTIIHEFADKTAFAAGEWFLTATTVSGLGHLEGETISLITDGAVPETEVVTGGSVTISQPASIIHAGLRYTGVMETLPLDQGGQSGPAQTKIKIVSEVAVRFVNSAGVQFGTSPYNLERIEFRTGNDITDRPVPLFTGIGKSSYRDSYEEDKQIYIIQDQPLPCDVAGLDIYMETTEE